MAPAASARCHRGPPSRRDSAPRPSPASARAGGRHRHGRQRHPAGGGRGAPGQPSGSWRSLPRRALGQDTFTHNRLGAATVEATLRGLEGFRRIMDTYRVVRYRAVATSAVREARTPRPSWTGCGSAWHRHRGDRRLRENRLTYMAVREALRGHPALSSADALLVDVGGGSADISFLENGEPIHSGTYTLGSIRMRQNGLLARQLRAAHAPVAPPRPQRGGGHPARDALEGGPSLHRPGRACSSRRPASAENSRPAPSGGGQRPFLALCDELAAFEVDELVERYRIPHADAETLVPALLANRELLLEPRPARSWPPTPRSGPACCSTSPAARTAWASGLRQAGAGQR